MLFIRRQEGVAPGDGIAHGLLALGRIAPRLRPAAASVAPAGRSRVGTGSAFTRAAASSIASGRPSSRRQISATAAALSAVNAKAGDTAWARSANSRTESRSASCSGEISAVEFGKGNGAIGYSRSPPTLSGSRLVTRTVNPGAPFSSSATDGAASTTCSKLSSRRSVFVSGPRTASRAWTEPDRVDMPNTAAMAGIT